MLPIDQIKLNILIVDDPAALFKVADSSFEVLVEVVGASDHHDPNAKQDAQRDQNFHGTLPVCLRRIEALPRMLSFFDWNFIRSLGDTHTS